MQMEYRGCVINLLDTPGHQDFSEDTYRVLTAVDAALMVIDAANGVEPQTRRLLQVCRARNTPILTFVNKMDREVQEPLDADGRDRARARHERRAVHLAGRHGQALPRRDRPARASRCACSRPGEDRDAATTTRSSRASTTRPTPSASATQYEQARGRHRAGARRRARVRPRGVPRRPADADVLRLGDQQLRRARGARRAGRPRAAAGTARRDRSARSQPDEPKFTGVVFKIQANMDPAHRDRIAFVRVCLGALRARHAAEGRALGQGAAARTRSSASCRSGASCSTRPIAGDIIGIPNHGVLQLGDTLTEGEALQFTGLPFFAPEMFRTRRGRRSAAHQAAARRPDAARRGGRDPGVPAGRGLGAAARRGRPAAVRGRRAPARARVRRQGAHPAEPLPGRALGDLRPGRRRRQELQRFIDGNAHRVAYDAVDAPTVLVEYAPELRAIESNWPKIRFHALREHAGLVFQKQLEG